MNRRILINIQRGYDKLETTPHSYVSLIRRDLKESFSVKNLFHKNISI